MLNRLQRQAVATDQSTFVEAPPGTGKTHIVVAKVCRDIRDAAARGRGIACLTYTNVARDEISERLGSALGDEERRFATILTVNAFCLSTIVRPRAASLGYEGEPRIATAGTRAFREAAASALRGYASTAALPYRVLDLEKLLQFTWRDIDGTARGDDFGAASQLLRAAVPRFWEALRSSSHLDHPTVLYEASRALSNEHYAHNIAAQFEWLIVDEYQDSSVVQLDIFRKLWKTGRTRLLLIGDLNQTIYSFNGASFAELNDFPATIGAKRLSLDENYRFGEAIAIVANRVFQREIVSSGSAEHLHSVVRWTIGDATERVACGFLPELRELKLPLERTALLCYSKDILREIAMKLRGLGIPIVLQVPRTDLEWFARVVERVAAGAASCRAADREVAVDSVIGLLDHFEVMPRSIDAQSVMRDTTYLTLIDAGNKLDLVESVASQIGPIVSVILESMRSSELFLPRAIADVRAGLLQQWQENKKSDWALEPIADTVERLAPKRSLRAMSIHASKGSQFDAVALVHVDSYAFPHTRSNSLAAKWEDLRKLYVASTRPRTLLWLHSSPGRSSAYLKILSGADRAVDVIQVC